MSKEFFKNLPDTSTPITASRMNGLLNGEEAMGSIAVEDVKCKNLLNEDNPTNSTVNWSGSGSTHYFTADGSWKYLEWLFDVKAGEEYTFSYKDRNTDNLYLYIAELIDGNVVRTIVADGIYTKESFKIENDCILRIRFMNNAIISNVPIEQLMLNKGLEKLSYTPYKKFSYNENESMGKIVVDDIKCKNLFNKDSATLNNWYIQTSNNSILSSTEHRTTYLKVNPNTTYTISKKVGAQFRIGTTVNAPALKGIVTQTIANHTGSSITITTGANDNYLVITFWSTSDTITLDEMLSTIQVELGNKVTPYTPHKNFDGRVDIITGQECPTNEYIDGERVYVKRLLFDTSTLNYVNVADNVKDLVDARMFVKQKGQRIYRPIPWLFNSTDSSWYGGFMIVFDSNNSMKLATQIGASLGDVDLVEVTIKYTKNSTSSASTTSTSSTMSLRPDTEELENESTSLEDEVNSLETTSLDEEMAEVL